MLQPSGDAPANQTSEEDRPVARPRLLIVDDNETVLTTLREVLRHGGFDVEMAASVNEALRFINSQPFDALLSDLHMPGAGDGLTVVSAMRHINPKAVTLIFSGYPKMSDAVQAILMQTDEILLKPLAPRELIQKIKARLAFGVPSVGRITEPIGDILDDQTQSTIRDWLTRIALAPHILTVPLSPEQRSAHLPHLFRDLVYRLNHPLPLGSNALPSPAATAHGFARRAQGYTAAMLVEESRMLQVSIFQTLQNNLYRMEFSFLLLAVMTIADEVDSQLAQAMAGYIAEAKSDQLPLLP